MISSEASLADRQDRRRRRPGGRRRGPARHRERRGARRGHRHRDGGRRAARRRRGRRPQGPPGGNRSEILRISPAGVVEKIWSFADETVYDLLWRGGGLWVGTGLEGKLYRFGGTARCCSKKTSTSGRSWPAPAAAGDRACLCHHQRRGLLPRHRRDASRAAPTPARRSTPARSPASAPSAGSGEPPGRTALRFSFRSGMSAEPDRTWSAWTEPRKGEEIATWRGLPLRPAARPLRAVARRAAGRAAAGRRASTAPSCPTARRTCGRRSTLVAALEPGQRAGARQLQPVEPGLRAGPSQPRGDLHHPGPSQTGDEGRTKPLWKKGFRTLSWSASRPQRRPPSSTTSGSGRHRRRRRRSQGRYGARGERGLDEDDRRAQGDLLQLRRHGAAGRRLPLPPGGLRPRRPTSRRTPWPPSR